MEQFFNGCQSLREAKHRYLALAREYHPVNGKDPITIFQIRLEYQQLTRDPFYAFYQHLEDIQDDFMKYPNVVDKLLGWKLKVEMIGTWTWVSGETYPYREQLSELGFYYESTKQSWYSRPSSCRSSNPSPLSFDKIKSLHARTMGTLVTVNGQTY